MNDKTDKKNYDWLKKWDELQIDWERMYLYSKEGLEKTKISILPDVTNIYRNVESKTHGLLWDFLKPEPDTEYIRINSEWLNIWFAAKVLSNDGLKDRYLKQDCRSSYSPIDRFEYFYHLSAYMLYQIHCIRSPDKPFADIPDNPMVAVLDALTYLVGRYAHVAIGLDREFALNEHLRDLSVHEVLAYVTRDLYSDHLVHVINVCLLGYLLLDSEITSKDKKVVDWFAAELMLVEPETVLKNWFAAALMHDLGYILEIYEHLLDPTQFIKSPEADKLHELLQDALDEYRESVHKMTFSSLPIQVKKSKIMNHGVMSWRYLQNLLGEMRKGNKQLSELEPCMIAVIKHGLSDAEIDAQKEPLAFLLLLCDHLQEWGRPQVEPNLLSRIIESGIHYSGTIDLESFFDHLAINLRIEDHKVVLDPHNKLRFKIVYRNTEIVQLEPSVKWVVYSRNLQRVILSEDMPVFELSILCPISGILKELGPLTEMDILEDYVEHNREAMCLSDWIQTTRRGSGERCVTYVFDEGEKTEELIINLNELGGSKIIPRLPDDLYLQFRQWKQRRLAQMGSTQAFGSLLSLCP